MSAGGGEAEALFGHPHRSRMSLPNASCPAELAPAPRAARRTCCPQAAHLAILQPPYVQHHHARLLRAVLARHVGTAHRRHLRQRGQRGMGRVADISGCCECAAGTLQHRVQQQPPQQAATAASSQQHVERKRAHRVAPPKQVQHLKLHRLQQLLQPEGDAESHPVPLKQNGRAGCTARQLHAQAGEQECPTPVRYPICTLRAVHMRKNPFKSWSMPLHRMWKLSLRSGGCRQSGSWAIGLMRPRCALCRALRVQQRNMLCMAAGRRRSPTLVPRPTPSKAGGSSHRGGHQASPACLDVHRLGGGQHAPHHLLVAGGASACGLHHQAAVQPQTSSAAPLISADRQLAGCHRGLCKVRCRRGGEHGV